MKKIVLGISGASGSIYAKYIMDTLLSIPGQWQKVGVVLSDNAIINWELEIGNWNSDLYPFEFYDKRDFNAPFASGSARYDTMIVCPCSMGTLARINAGISDELITRAADVIIKERRKLILVPRETPFSTIHLRNMLSLSESGVVICPAVPSFYSKTKDVADLVRTVTNRVLDLAGFDLKTERWGEGEN